MKFNKLILASLLFIASFSVFALEVNRNELQTGMDGVIQFENYTGPHAKIDTIEAIRSIGTSLGKQTAAAPDKAGTFSLNGKYSVIHAIDPSVKEKLDADIIIIDASATVDHITNLRRIIAAYLVAAYNYSESDASTLATFITVYNAVYRGNTQYFQSKYKDTVTKNLTADKCGLSTKWSEWAGKSQIVIPLYDVLNGGISTIDTSVISDKQVVESMREEDDHGIDERKNLVDIKEREAEQATEKAQESAKKAAETKEAVQKQQEVQKQAETKAEEKKQAAEVAKAEAAAEPDNKEKQQAAEEAVKEAEEAAEEAEDEKEKTEELKQEAKEAVEEAAEQQALADKKQTEATSERKEIAVEQKEMIDQAIADAAKQNVVVGLKVTDSQKQLSAMVKVDALTGETIRESPVNVIRGRTILPVAEEVIISATSPASQAGTQFTTSPLMYVAICGENNGNGAIKLCLLDSANMEIQKESDEVLAEDSVLVQSGMDYYCVISDNGTYVVGKYDAGLKLHLKSTVAVNPATPITVTPKGVIVTAANGQLLLLGLKDLAPITPVDTVPEK